MVRVTEATLFPTPTLVFSKLMATEETPLYAEEIYFVRVRACNAIGWGAFSKERVGLTMDRTF